MAKIDQEITIGQIDHGETGHYVRDNRLGPTAKIVRSVLTSDDGVTSLIEDPVGDPILAGQKRITHLEPLNVKVVRFHINWTQVGMGLAHSVDVPAPHGRYFRSFALRWGDHDQVSVQYTTAPV
jgi:hypothetical protein